MGNVIKTTCALLIAGCVGGGGDGGGGGAGSGAGTPGASTVRGDALVRELGGADRQTLCEWIAEQRGDTDTEVLCREPGQCNGVDVGDCAAMVTVEIGGVQADECVADLTGLDASCTVTVDELETCMQLLSDAPCDVLTARDSTCAQFANCMTASGS